MRKCAATSTSARAATQSTRRPDTAAPSGVPETAGGPAIAPLPRLRDRGADAADVRAQRVRELSNRMTRQRRFALFGQEPGLASSGQEASDESSRRSAERAAARATATRAVATRRAAQRRADAGARMRWRVAGGLSRSKRRAAAHVATPPRKRLSCHVRLRARREPTPRRRARLVEEVDTAKDGRRSASTLPGVRRAVPPAGGDAAPGAGAERPSRSSWSRAPSPAKARR